MRCSLSSELTLSVVDQSPMRHGETGAQALRDTVELAKATEALGYSRFWVAEHHSAGTFAGTSPEILIGQILAHTSRIRVGSGGVMLTHYSALKVAEQFRVLESFYPGRVDLGIGRAPGSDQRTMLALAYPKRPVDVETFPQQVVDVVGYLYDALQPDHPFAALKAAPGGKPESAPDIWLLGSSDYSARLAAQLGLPFAFADFFGTTSGHGPAVAEIYRREFQPSELCAEARLNVTVQVICAPTAEEVQRVTASRNFNRARRVLAAQGEEIREGLLPPEEAAAMPLTEAARAHVQQYVDGCIDGDPDQVKAGILTASERDETTDIGIVSIAYALVDRIRSYELVARAFGLL
ncbi:MAG: LLM class flavin-dependent oxidoreductase [Chloroflexi bacterium]|nr:LLM class flavin-dependent oxidoreductase [Chloroflexota bacterium]